MKVGVDTRGHGLAGGGEIKAFLEEIQAGASCRQRLRVKIRMLNSALARITCLSEDHLAVSELSDVTNLGSAGDSVGPCRCRNWHCPRTMLDD